MTYWKYQNIRNVSPSIPGYVYGSALTFTLVFVNDSSSAFTGSYVFVDPEYFNMLSVKLTSEGDTAWKEVLGVMDAQGYIGYIAPNSETSIDFRFQNTGDDEMRMYKIQVYLAHDDGAHISSFKPFFESTLANHWLWAECYENQNLWRDEYTHAAQACLSDLDPAEGFSDSLEPQLFEDSYEPSHWD